MDTGRTHVKMEAEIDLMQLLLYKPRDGKDGQQSPEAGTETWPCQHLGFGLLVSKVWNEAFLLL